MIDNSQIFANFVPHFMAYGVIGNTIDSDSVIFGSSPDRPVYASVYFVLKATLCQGLLFFTPDTLDPHLLVYLQRNTVHPQPGKSCVRAHTPQR